MSRLDHPGYFAFIPSCGTFPGALGDFIAVGAERRTPARGWRRPARASVELLVLDWFKEWIGYPAERAGRARRAAARRRT